MKFDDILKLQGIDPARCRYLRHTSSELATAGWENNPATLFRNNRAEIEDYQTTQRKGELVWRDHVISLAAFGGRRALFLGVYRVIERNVPFVKHPRDKEFRDAFGWEYYTMGVPGKTAA